MAEYKVTDTDMTAVADAIRTKGQTTEPLTFPDGMVQAIGDIPLGDPNAHKWEDYFITHAAHAPKSTYHNDRVTGIYANGLFSWDGLQIERFNFSKVTFIGVNGIRSCRQIILDFNVLDYIKSRGVLDCTKLLLIIRTNKVCKIEADSISNSTLYAVYVPDDLVVQYKTATNWTQYANLIKPLSQAPPE